MTNAAQQASWCQGQNRHVDHLSYAFSEEPRIASASQTYTCIFKRGIWEIRQKCESGDKTPQSNNLHYTFLLQWADEDRKWHVSSSLHFFPLSLFSLILHHPFLPLRQNGSPLYPPWKHKLDLKILRLPPCLKYSKPQSATGFMWKSAERGGTLCHCLLFE